VGPRDRHLSLRLCVETLRLLYHKVGLNRQLRSGSLEEVLNEGEERKHGRLAERMLSVGPAACALAQSVVYWGSTGLFEARPLYRMRIDDQAGQRISIALTRYRTCTHPLSVNFRRLRTSVLPAQT